MEKINIAEMLKDCPKGMELDCALYENLEFDYIEENSGNAYIVCRVKVLDGYNIHTFTKYGCCATYNYAKCVIFPKGKTTWEGFIPPYKFKEGDIVSAHVYTGGVWIGIFKQANTNSTFEVHCSLDTLGKFHTSSNKHLLDNTHLATKEEKERLFKVIESEGYKWNPETKTLEKLIVPKFKVGDKIKLKNSKSNIISLVTKINDDGSICVNYYTWVIKYELQDRYEVVSGKFDINTLKPFDKVLVRSADSEKWKCDFFSNYEETYLYKFKCVGCNHQCCIPYKGNEHLLGKTDDCDNFFKTWEE